MVIDNGKEYRVVAITPAGRKEYLEILKRYIDRDMERGLIDEWQLWLNTGVQEDIEYINSIESNKITIRKIKGLNAQDTSSIHKFFTYTQDDDTIYIRFDDDIVFVHESMVPNLLKARLDNKEPFAVFANIVNNAACSFYQQEIGAVGKEFGEVPFNRFAELNHKNFEFAQYLHRNFINKYNSNQLESYYFENKIIPEDDGISINSFAFFGKDMKELPDRDEEAYISTWRPKELRRFNMVCGDALVVHFAFHPQRKGFDDNSEIINFYKNICQK